jgi:hypothetical protein
MLQFHVFSAPFALAVIATAPTAGGCEGLLGPSRLEQTIAAEQKAIEAYDAAIPAVDNLAGEFTTAWARAHRHSDPRMLRDDLKAHALPAAAAWLAALRGMPVQSNELKAIHEPLVSANAALVDALKTYAESPVDGDAAARLAPVETAFAAMRKAEIDYRRGLETWYAKNRTTLVAPAAPAASDPAPDAR